MCLFSLVWSWPDRSLWWSIFACEVVFDQSDVVDVSVPVSLMLIVECGRHFFFDVFTQLGAQYDLVVPTTHLTWGKCPWSARCVPFRPALCAACERYEAIGLYLFWFVALSPYAFPHVDVICPWYSKLRRVRIFPAC